MTRCDCQKQKIIRTKLDEIPERFRNAMFSNYIPVDGKQKSALDKISGNITGSFFLYGDYARGKTHLTTAQYIKHIRLERSCLFMTMAELMTELRRAEMSWATDPRSQESRGDYFCEVRDRARYAPQFHLFIDDIDKFKITDFKFEVLFDLINTLYKRKLGLTVTSNYSLNELTRGQTIHTSILRRLDDMCQAVEV